MIRHIHKFSLLICVACASESKVNNPSVEMEAQEQELLTQFPEIKNKDFENEELPYESELDLYESTDDNNLSKETIDRFEEDKISKIKNDLQTKDPVGAATALCYKKEFVEAFSLLDSIYKKHKTHPNYWTAIGTCYFLSNQKRKAQLYYDKAVDVDKKYAPSLNNLGVIYQQLGDDQKALSAYKKAEDYNPYSLTPLFNKAQLYLQYGLVEEAHEIFKILYNKGRSDVDVLSGLGNSSFFLNKIEDSINFFSKIEKKYLVRPDIGINYAYALYVDKKVDLARNIFSNIEIELIPASKNYYTQIGKLIGER
jgi:tetratricopeptide (TPR) repeat protein